MFIKIADIKNVTKVCLLEAHEVAHWLVEY